MIKLKITSRHIEKYSNETLSFNNKRQNKNEKILDAPIRFKFFSTSNNLSP